MESEVTLEAGICDGEMPAAIGLGWMNGFHTAVEPQNKIVEVEAKAKSVGDCYLPPELIELELTARLVLVVPDCPDIACIDEGCPIEFPKEVGAILNIQIQLDVTGLIDEVNSSV